MKLESLLLANAPRGHLISMPASKAFDAMRSLPSSRSTVRFVRGAKGQTKAALLDELSAALQFPPGFGDNWDACSDGLRDLSWIDGTGDVLLCVLDAPALLSHATPSDRETFDKILADAIAPRSGKGRGLRVVLQAEDEATLLKRWPSMVAMPRK